MRGIAGIAIVLTLIFGPALQASGHTSWRVNDDRAIVTSTGRGTTYFTKDWASGWGAAAYVVGYEHVGADVTPKYKTYRSCDHHHSGSGHHRHSSLRCKMRYKSVQSVYKAGIKVGIGPISSPCWCKTFRSYVGDRDHRLSYWWRRTWAPGVL